MSLPPPSNNGKGNDDEIFINLYHQLFDRTKDGEGFGRESVKYSKPQTGAPFGTSPSGAPVRRSETAGTTMLGAVVGFWLLVGIVAGAVQTILYVFRQAGISEWSLSPWQSVLVSCVLVFTRLADRAILGARR